MLFYDFEVFKYNWLVVIKDTNTRQEQVIIDDTTALERFHAEHINEIWVGFNSRHYDQYIFKGILCGFDPKQINDFIIVKGNPGWKFSSLLRRIKLNNYDVMTNIDRGLKSFEGFMGNNIKESSVPFDIDRPLTPAEIEETVQYCRHDVEQTMEIFVTREADKEPFAAHLGLVKLACENKTLDMSLISKTGPQLSAIILNAVMQDWNDEFDIDFPSTMRIEKYTAVLDWYRNPENHKYKVNPANPKSKKHCLEMIIAGVPHVFGYGGVHGALEKYHGKGYFINMDVASLYPSLMIKYGLLSRNVKNSARYEEIYNQRLQYKRENNPLQISLKLILNSTYGVMKDKTNALYDPRQANRVCIYGQILLLDLIERLEPYCQIIQSNTDGVLIKMPDGGNPDDFYALIDDVCWEWEQRTALTLEFKEFTEVFQKDVNNYIMIDADRKFKSKGAYVKKLSPLDYDLPIINRALVEFMIHGVPIEQTINDCDDLKEFQLVTKISGKYTHILHGNRQIKENCIRVFASKDETDAGVQKLHARSGKPVKMPNSPLNCFIFNDEVNGVKVPDKLDKSWYIALANKRLGDFGCQ